jgi:hypothetical protein
MIKLKFVERQEIINRLLDLIIENKITPEQLHLLKQLSK